MHFYYIHTVSLLYLYSTFISYNTVVKASPANSREISLGIFQEKSTIHMMHIVTAFK